jgi:DNA-binding LytR/AlgR family response regulator
LLLDDELPGLSYLKILCEQIPELDVVKAFDSPEVFMRDIPQLDFDLCILDIEMPGINGLEIAALLRGKAVIFTTAYSEYAAEAFDLNAVDYVRKPVQKERLHQAISKAIAKATAAPTIKPEKSYIQVNTDKGKALLYFDKIAYVGTSTTDSRDKLFHLTDGNEWVVKNISYNKLTKLLPENDFCRINKQELLALDLVEAFSFGEIILKIKDLRNKSVKLTLSESYRNEFLQKIRI